MWQRTGREALALPQKKGTGTRDIIAAATIGDFFFF